MGVNAKVSGMGGNSSKQSSRSSRSIHLYQIQKEARKIREDHAKGKISAEEAAKQLRELHSSPHGHFFSLSWNKVSA